VYHVISCGVNAPPSADILAYAEKDAEDIASVFQSAIGPVSSEGVTVLLGRDASEEGILTAFLEVAIRQPDYLVFYFSGHGNDDGIAAANGLIGYDTLASFIRMVDSPYTFVVLDVCSAASAAPFLKEARVGGVGALKESWLAALANATPGTRLIFSTGAGRKAGESKALANSVFTHYFVKALREASGDLSVDDVSWISDRRASFSARRRMMLAGIEQVPLFYNLTGDFPLAISQSEEPVGIAHFIRTTVSRNSLDVAFRVQLREGLKTKLVWELSNGRGDVIASGSYKTDEAAATTASFSGSIPCPHDKLKSDIYTRVSAMTSGAAPVAWSLSLYDEANNLLDSGEVRATYRMPQANAHRRR